jgi:hypothetical protein
MLSAIGWVLMKYEIVFLDHGGQIFSSAVLDAADDQEAIEKARRIHSTNIGSGYQIRRGGTVIHFEMFGPKASGSWNSSGAAA